MRTKLGTLCGALLMAGLVGCGSDTTSPDRPWDPTAVMPDFSLRDVNPNSPRYDQMVSPRHYLGSVSAFYFGSAT